MSNFTLNIGLTQYGETSENQNQLNRTLSLLTKSLNITDLKIVNGEYEGVTERTLVVNIKNVNRNTLVYILSGISVILNQDSIAVLDNDNNEGFLVFNKNSNNFYEFSLEYFNKL